MLRTGPEQRGETMKNPFEQGKQLCAAAGRKRPGILQLDVMMVMETSKDSVLLMQSLIREHEQLPSRIVSELEKRGLKEGQVHLSLSLCFYKDLSMDMDAIRMCSVTESEKVQQYASAVSENPGMMQSGLEALYCAMCSRPRQKRPFRAQYILVYAVSPVYPLENPMNRIDPEYPLLLERNVLPYSPDIPGSLEELKQLWLHPGESNLDPFHSFLVIHALPSEIWNGVGQWNRADFQAVESVRELCQAWNAMPADLAERVAADLRFRPDGGLRESGRERPR